MAPRLAFWKIRCLSREEKCFFDRFLVLDQAALPPEELDRFFALADDETTKRRAHLEFRPHFVPCDKDKFGVPDPDTVRVSLGGPVEYFEDEAGNPLDNVGVMQILTGEPDPILRGEPRSVLRLGPSPIANREEWTVEKANTISHFLQVMTRIGQSGWLRSPLSIRISGAPVEVVHPNADLTTAGLAYIRQLLLRRDDVLNRACDAYSAHIQHAGRRAWVLDVQNLFNSYLDSDAHGLFQSFLAGRTSRQIIDLFTYGPGLFHRESNDNCEAQLATLIAQHGCEKLIFALNSVCRLLLEHAFHLVPVMWQDVSHWVRTEGCSPPDRVHIHDLFGE